MNINSEKTWSSDDEKKKKVIKGVIIALFIIIIILLITSCVGKGESEGEFDLTPDENCKAGALSTPDVDEIRKNLNEQVEKGMINISMNMNPVFESGTSEGNLLIVNEEINTYPQIVEIYLKDSNELIYKSGGIAVGSCVEKGTLLVDLDEGSYDAVAYFNAVDPATSTLVGKAGAEIVITVLS